VIVPSVVRCIAHGTRVAADPPGEVEAAAALACVDGCRFPVRRGIPRFVGAGDYATGFGLQWNAYRSTQLDSATGTTLSRDRLARCLGGTLEAVRDRRVLEVGCGAGRFTEVLLAVGAQVVACDLSDAVEANHANCASRARPGAYFVCQADALALPLEPAAFDVVLALGMVQHTPSPERTIAALAAQVRPGGRLVLDHYTYGAGRGALWKTAVALSPRGLLRQLLRRLAPPAALSASRGIVRTLLPLHRVFWRPGRLPRLGRRVLHYLSPVFDYYDTLPQLPPALLTQWALLDTHDGLTDRYKHLRSREQVADALRACGLVEVVAAYAGNGVEARARRAEAP
jgi:SAM-dependent methyltransferase